MRIEEKINKTKPEFSPVCLFQESEEKKDKDEL